MLFYVIDNEFNQANYSDIIGLIYSNPPSYANVIELPDPYRLHECWKCNNEWMVSVKFKNNSNLSGESIEWCPECHSKSSCASSWIQSNGNPFPFPEPIKQNELLPLDNRVLNVGNYICKWWNQSNETGGHWDNVGYKQGLRDCLEIMVKHHLIKDYSMTDGITLMELDQQLNKRKEN